MKENNILCQRELTCSTKDNNSFYNRCVVILKGDLQVSPGAEMNPYRIRKKVPEGLMFDSKQLFPVTLLNVVSPFRPEQDLPVCLSDSLPE